MIREMLRRPLEQAMTVLWLVTIVHLLNRALAEHWTLSWSISSALAGLLAMLLAVRYHLLRLIAVPIVLELSAFLTLLSLLGLQISGLALAAVCFALLLWLFCRYAGNSPTLRRVHDLLRLHFEDDNDIGVAGLVWVTHITLFLITACALAVQLSHSALFNVSAVHSWVVLLTLLVALSLLRLSQDHYASALNSYLMLALVIGSVMELLSLTVHSFAFPELASDPYAGLLCITLAALMMFVAAGLQNLSSLDQTLYRMPLLVTATALVALALVLQWHFFLEIELARVGGLDILVMFSAGALLLFRNRGLRWPYLNTFAIALLVMAVMWLIFGLLHPGATFSLWLGPSTYADQWLILALLSVLLSSLAVLLEYRESRFSRYCQSFNNIASAAYLWCLLGTLNLFFSVSLNESVLLIWLLMVLLVGQLPVLRSWPYSEHFRGVGVIVLLLILEWMALAVAQHLNLFRVMLALNGYLLWLVSVAALPKWNRRFSSWAISPLLWPWAGLFLLLTALLQGGPVWIEEWPGLVLLVVYLLLMNKFFLDLPALLLAVLSLLWLQSVLLHPDSFSLRPVANTAADIWFSVSAIALLFSLLSNYAPTMLLQRFRKPLQQASLLCFTWCLIGSSVLFITDVDHVLMPAIALMLLLTLFSLSGVWPHGERLRGIGGGILLTLIVVSSVQQLSLSLLAGLVAHSYFLWWASYRWLPRFNLHYPSLAVEARSWAWTGLLLMFAGSLWLEGFANPETMGYLLALCIYSVLMRRYCSLVFLPWVAALCFTLLGPTFAAWCWLEPGSDDMGSILSKLLNNLDFILLWLNLQILLVHLRRRYIKRLPQLRVWLSRSLIRALFFFADLALLVSLPAYAYYAVIFSDIVHGRYDDLLNLSVVASGLLLSVTYLNAISYSCRAFRLHGLLIAVSMTAWAFYPAFPIAFVHPPIYLSLCCLAWMGAFYWVRESSPLRHKILIASVLNSWLKLILIAATGALLFNVDYSFRALLTNLAVVVAMTAFYGLWMLSWAWFVAACFELLLLMHGWPFLWLTLGDLNSLYPWYALQAAALAWLFLLLVQRTASPKQINQLSERRRAMTQMVLHSWPWLMGVSLFELSIHILQLRYWLMGYMEPKWLLPPLDSFTAMMAGLIIVGVGVRHVRKYRDSSWVYGIVALMVALGFYWRLLLLGIAPLGFWDTALLIIFAYALLLLHRSFPSRPLLNLALMMPVFALLTVPFQLESPEASLTLMISGVFYLMIRRNEPQLQLPVYLSLLAFNIGIYLWVPGFVEYSRLLQVYVIPAALSTLVLLQLHRRDLKQNVLMAGRLAALSIIYAAATLDVFLLPDLRIFMLAMGLSLLGLILGIAVRVRAYLYAGVSFLLLNVAGQFINYYPEEMLGKAIVLMVLGALIIAAMIWFNIKRAEILSQFRSIQEELEAWE